MIFKVFGKTNNKFSRWVCQETVKRIKERLIEGDDVEFYDMDKPLGKNISDEENIYYVPTVICEDGEIGELGYIENKFALGTGDQMSDMNKSSMWWLELDKFIIEMKELKSKKDNAL